MNDSGQLKQAALRRAIVSLGGLLLLLAVALIVPAGIGWTMGWVFLMVFVLQRVMAAVYLWRKNPDIVIARSKLHAGTKGWDKVALLVLILSLTAMFVTAGLDSRLHWSSAPLWLVVLGYVLLSIGTVGSAWVQSVNKFAERGVRIQTERGHKVVNTGPYAIVRHPFYVTIFFFYFGIPLALGSFWALIPATVASLILVVRTVFEDRLLQNELEGYREYASQVRYRLILGVW